LPATDLADGATTRYEMAAWLISQYTGFAGGLVNDAKDRNIQNAIWDLTNNNTDGAENGGAHHVIGGLVSDAYNPGDPDNHPGSEAYWIDQAYKNYTTVDPFKWAVVTWNVNPDGTFAVGNYDIGERQTFLVQLTPEPGFYGVLSIGLTGLIWAVRRRKNA
jgi:hypothetical protein